MSTDRVALGAFLRAHRDRLTPAQAGIDPFPGPRRVPGLRKEELAFLAGLSSDHYSRIEQGRQRTLSVDVVAALASALRLDDVERAHLHNLAGPSRPSAVSTWERAQRPDPGMLRMMSALDDVPVLLLGRRSEVLARNALLVEVLSNDLAPGSMFLNWLLLDPSAKDRIMNWPEFAAAAVGGLRFELGRHPRDGRLQDLIDTWRRAEPAIDDWWNDQRVTDRTSLVKRIDHPAAGHLEFGIETLITPHDPEQRLVVYTVQPDSPTARALPLLASWAATPVERVDVDSS